MFYQHSSLTTNTWKGTESFEVNTHPLIIDEKSARAPSMWVHFGRGLPRAKMGLKKYDFYVRQGRPWYKIILEIFKSHLGLSVVCLVYVVAGEAAMTCARTQLVSSGFKDS